MGEDSAIACGTCGCPDRRWLSVAEVAGQFGFSPKHVRRLLAAGELSGVRLGREWRIDHDALDRLVFGKQGGQPGAPRAFASGLASASLGGCAREEPEEMQVTTTRCGGEIYIATILLEPNRWTDAMRPSYAVSEWLGRFRDAGFDGMEVWENHAALCGPRELEALAASDFPCRVFNTYAGFDAAGAEQRARAAQLADRLGAGRVKFNFGSDAERLDEYLAALTAWAGMLPDGCRPLCECHHGTVLEEPERAADAFRRLGGLEVEVIVHPLFLSSHALRRWLDAFGANVTHAHVQLRDEHGVFQRLGSSPGLVRERLAILAEGGFRGSFSLEFTAGTRTRGETHERLWRNALADLAFLREHWATGD
jgi:excisionase family DNA binding protein